MVRFKYSPEIGFTTKLKAIRNYSIREVTCVADTGCTYTAIGLDALCKFLDMNFEDFRIKYKDVLQKAKGNIRLPNGQCTSTIRICLYNVTFTTDSSLITVDKFYCNLLIQDYALVNGGLSEIKHYNADIIKDYQVVRKDGKYYKLHDPLIYLGLNFIRACDSLSFYNDRLYLGNLDYKKYLKYSRSDINVDCVFAIQDT